MRRAHEQELSGKEALMGENVTYRKKVKRRRAYQKRRKARAKAARKAAAGAKKQETHKAAKPTGTP